MPGRNFHGVVVQGDTRLKAALPWSRRIYRGLTDWTAMGAAGELGE
jgi:hypothetical protein